jgi:hypothetical protein
MQISKIPLFELPRCEFPGVRCILMLVVRSAQLMKKSINLRRI